MTDTFSKEGNFLKRERTVIIPERFNYEELLSKKQRLLDDITEIDALIGECQKLSLNK